MMGFVASLFCIFIPSCMNEEYEMSEEKLDLEATVFQEGVSLPLGSSAKIKIKDLLDDLDPEVKEYFEKNANGELSIGMDGQFDMSEELDFIEDFSDIDAVSFNEDFPFDLASVDASGITAGPYEFSYEQYLSEVIENVEIDIPLIAPDPFTQTADISGFDSEGNMSMEVDAYHYDGKVATVDLPVPIPDIAKNDTPLPILSQVLKDLGVDIQTYDSFDMSASPIEVPLRFELPSLIKDVNEITFDGAKVKMSLQLKNHIFHSGSIVPHVDVDLHSIFHLENGTTQDHIIADFVLDENDNYTSEQVYGIASLVVNPEDIKEENGRRYFDKTITVAPEVSLTYKDLMTTTNLLAEHTGDDVMAYVTMEFIDLKVKDIVMTVEPVNVPVDQTIPMSVDPISLPDMINGVDEVTFTDNSGFDLYLTVANADRIRGLDLSVDALALTFPEELVVEGADDSGKLIVQIGTLSDGTLQKTIKVNGLRPQPAVNGAITLDGEIKVEAVAVAGVKDGEWLHTSDLPQTPSQDITISVRAEGNLEVADFKVDFGGYEHKVEMEKEKIEVDIPAEVAELGTLSANLEGEPAITINIDLPQTDLPIVPAAEGLIVKFPQMLVFKDVPSEFNAASNTLILTESIPSEIVLPIEKIVVTPEKVGEKWVSYGEVEVSGGIAVAAGIVSKADVDALTDPSAKVSFVASVPELKPATVDFDEYKAHIDEEVSFGEFSIDELPKEVVSVEFIELDQVFLDFNVKAAGINAIVKDADVNLDLSVVLPEIISVEQGKLENGVLKVKGTLNENEEIVIEPIRILGLDLSGVDIHGEDPFKDMKIDINGDIMIQDATIDLGALDNSDLNMTVEASIKSAHLENRIGIANVTGKVDYEVPAVVETIDLSEFTALLNTEELKTQLDIDRFNLKLELETNLMVPVEATLNMTPYKGGVAGEVVSTELELDMPESSGETSFIRYWISNTEEGMLSGYEFVELDLVGMLKQMPDSIAFNIAACTDATKDCVLDPSADQVLKANYAAEIPIALGPDFQLEFNTKVEGLPAELGDILKMGSLALTGEITSSLPLELELTMSLLDSEGNAVELAENAGKQVIKACGIDGSPVTTDLNVLMKIKPGADVSDISALGLNFKATSGNVSGVPVTEETFVQATLQALIPEGVTIDLGQYLESDKDNK